MDADPAPTPDAAAPGADEIGQALRANAEFARQFADAGLAPPPRRHLAVLTCMDARMLPERILGLAAGDAHVIRNAGGRASGDAVRSLVVSSRVLGTREVMVIHHTDCGMSQQSDDELRARLQEETGVDTSGFEPLCFGDLEGSVRDDVQRLRDEPLLGVDVTVRGFVYDVATGRLDEVGA